MLDHDAVKPWHVALMFLVFWTFWVLAGYHERSRHEAFFAEVQAFIHQGDRFTAKDGRELKARVEALEEQVETQND